MKTNQSNLIYCRTLAIILIIVCAPIISQSQHLTWYNNAQQRIDILRKGTFGIKIVDKEGNPYTGKVSVRMEKHEFPFGIAFDLQQAETTMGNTYSTNQAVQAPVDAEIYRTERWATFLAYAIPVVNGREYKITLKFAEIFHNRSNARIFDVKVNDELFLEKFDTYAVAGGRNIAVDTTLTIIAPSNVLRIELRSSVDNVAIKGIVVDELNHENILRINCGGTGLTTADGNLYVPEIGYFDSDVITVATNDDWRKATMLKYFNAGVNENSFKWSSIQPNYSTLNYTTFENAVRWTQKVGWSLRAHTLLWGGNDNHSMPNWVRSLPTPKAITDTCKMRVIRDVSRYRGIIKDYDVINEPLTGHADWLRKTVGDSIIWNSFKWARSADPEAELYINDYNVELNWGQSREYRDLVKKMLENGAPVTGIGVQAHFWDCCRPNINEVVNNMNILAETGLPIKLTEYDYGGNLTQAQQAADYIMVLTIAFSHPSIVGFYHWSLRDGWAWREGSGFFDSAGKPKLAADTLLYFTKTKWATNFDAEINNADPLNFSAYHGTYIIEAEFDGVVKEFTVPLLKANVGSIFELHETSARIKGPQLVKAELFELGKIGLTFDKPIKANSIRRGDFKFFSTGGIGIDAATIDPADETRAIVKLSRNVTPGQFLQVSYFPGSLVAYDGGVAKAFGPVALANPAPTAVDGVTIANSGSVRVYPNPAAGNVNIEFSSANYNIHIYNSNGLVVFSSHSERESVSIDTSTLSRGLYIVRITDARNTIYVEKLILH